MQSLFVTSKNFTLKLTSRRTIQNTAFIKAKIYRDLGVAPRALLNPKQREELRFFDEAMPVHVGAA